MTFNTENDPDTEPPMNDELFDEVTATIAFENADLRAAVRARLVERDSKSVDVAGRFNLSEQNLSRKVNEVRNVYRQYLEARGWVERTYAGPPDAIGAMDVMQKLVIQAAERDSSDE